MKKTLRKIYSKDGQDRLLPKFSLFIFDRSRTAAILWLCLTVFGIFSYTTLLKREGFPSVNVPYSFISGTYLVNDPEKVDRELAKPVGEIVLKDKRVASVQSQSQGMFYSVIVQYKEGTNAEQAGQEISQRIKTARILPKAATFKVEAPKIGFTDRGDDGVISVYAKDKVTSEQLHTEAEHVVAYLKAQKFDDVESISVIDPFTRGTDPQTGKMSESQTKFDRYGVRQNDQNVFYNSAAIGFLQKDGTDVIKLNNKIEEALNKYNREHEDSNYRTVVTATYAHDIQDQIDELQKALLEGLLAVLVVGSIVIAIRASLTTVLAMITVLAITLGVLFAIGYTLNTITLFSLILCMGLIVDDTIIMVEAIDAQRRKRKDPRETVKVATQKVSRAMVAATFTAVLSFAPLLFVGGILGSFIRAIPVTVITSLLVSLLVALIFIPLFARYLLLGKKQMGAENVHEPAAKIEAKVAQFVGRPMMWARHSKAKLFTVGIIAVVIGFGFIGAGGAIFQKVTFNIFPSSKDSNGLMAKLEFAPGTNIQQAEEIADRANKIIADELGKNFEYAAYYANAGTRDATMTIYITPYSSRDVTAPQLEKQLDKKLDTFEGAKVDVSQMAMGPPASAFNVHIATDDRRAALALAQDLNTFLTGKELIRTSGEKAKITETSVSDPGTYSRTDGKLYVGVTANFDGTDTTTLVGLAQDAIKKEFTSEKLQSYGLQKDVLQFDIGQEEENQESFQTLALAFPLLLFAIYLLLAVQFRSLAQPLLIFMAIPFSFFGISLGLYLTDNPFSFFAMLGFFALIGLSLKNTILLTDYANQLRRTGVPAIEAAVGALGERFRPLIATSFTAVVSLVPLALSSPFWEGLAVVLIFGLLSSTLLVITVFPYYYLGVEFLRMHISRKAGLLWLALTIAITVGLSRAGVASAIVPAIIVATIIQISLTKQYYRRKDRRSI